MTSALEVGGVVLCGGQSRRMGTSKAWLRFGTEYLLQRVVRIVGGVVQPVVVAARPGQSLPPLPDNVLVVYDAIENSGPLAGVAAGFDALADCREAALVVSCDHALLTASFITRLIELLGDHPAVVPRHQDRLHPLVAVYRLQTRTVLAHLLAQAHLRAHTFARRCGAHIVSAPDLKCADPNLSSLRNLNDPETYESTVRALERA